jgi:hypothetical protein
MAALFPLGQIVATPGAPPTPAQSQSQIPTIKTRSPIERGGLLPQKIKETKIAPVELGLDDYVPKCVPNETCHRFAIRS